MANPSFLGKCKTRTLYECHKQREISKLYESSGFAVTQMKNIEYCPRPLMQETKCKLVDLEPLRLALFAGKSGMLADGHDDEICFCILGWDSSSAPNFFDLEYLHIRVIFTSGLYLLGQVRAFPDRIDDGGTVLVKRLL